MRALTRNDQVRLFAIFQRPIWQVVIVRVTVILKEEVEEETKYIETWKEMRNGAMRVRASEAQEKKENEEEESKYGSTMETDETQTMRVRASAAQERKKVTFG